MLVLYGSQTGNAQDVAELVARKLIRRHIKTTVSSIDDYPIGEIVEENVIIFIVATTGQGEPTDNMKKFWKLLWQKSLPNDCFINLKFAVAGLGDSSYQKFNFVAKKLHKRLFQLGGSFLLPCTLADEQHPYGYNGAILPWLTNIMEKIDAIMPSILEKIPDEKLLPPSYTFKILSDDIKSMGEDIALKFDGLNIPERMASMPNSNLIQSAEVVCSERLTPLDHWQDVRLISLKFNTPVDYLPGDVCSVWPQNSSESVSEFLSLFSLNINDRFYLESKNLVYLDNFYPNNCTMEFLVKNYLDINGQPRQYFWELMKHFASNEMEKEKFEEFLSLEGQEELYSYCHRPRRTILEILNDFISTTSNIDIRYLLDLIPQLRPRSFSIASMSDYKSGKIDLLVAVVEYKTYMKKMRKGLASNFLGRLQCNDALRAQIIKTQFKFSMDVPLIMIGPGTGVAPFRSIIHLRTSMNIGDNYLFFGCRNENKDYFFNNEWKQLENKGLLKVFPAFSRDQDEKIYVQHLISYQKNLIWSLINGNACIYIAGSSKNMPDQVYDAIKDAIISESHMTCEKAEELLQWMQKIGRYQMETWS